MDRQKKIPSPSTKITRKLAQQSKGHSNLMNYYSKLSRDKSGAPVRWKMSKPIHVDEAAISGRFSPARASNTASGSKSDGDKTGKKIREKSSSAERSKSRDSSTGSRRSRRDSIDRKPEENSSVLSKKKRCVVTKHSKAKRTSLSAVAPVRHIPERMKRRPHSLDLNLIRDAVINGDDDDCFKSPDRLSPCNEIVKRKKGRPKQTPPKLEMEVPTLSETDRTEDTHSGNRLSNSTSGTAGASKSNTNEMTLDIIARSSAMSIQPVEDKQTTGTVIKHRARGRPPGSLNKSTLLIMKKFGTTDLEKIKQLKYSAQNRPSTSKLKSLVNTSKQVQLKTKKVKHQKNKASSKQSFNKNIDKDSDKMIPYEKIDASAVAVNSFKMNGDIDDPEVTFKAKVVKSDIKSEPPMKSVKDSKSIAGGKKNNLKTKAVTSLTKFKQVAKSALKVKKKRVIISQAIQTEDDALTQLATNDLRRKIQKKLLDKLSGCRKDLNKSVIIEKKCREKKITVENEKAIDLLATIDTLKPTQDIDMTAADGSLENKFNIKPEKASDVDILSAIIEQKRLLSKENSLPDRVKRKPGRKPKLEVVHAEQVVSDIVKESDTESLCSELSVQSNRSQSAERNKKIYLDQTRGEEPAIRTRQRCEILPPGGSKRKRTLSGEFHLLDEFKLRKKQRNLDQSEDHDDEVDNDFPAETNMIGMTEPANIRHKAKKVLVHGKEEQRRVKKVLTKRSVFVRKKIYSKPCKSFQKKKMLSPNQYKEIKASSPLIKKTATAVKVHETITRSEHDAVQIAKPAAVNASNNVSRSETMTVNEVLNVDNDNKPRVDGNNRVVLQKSIIMSNTTEQCRALKNIHDECNESTTESVNVDHANIVTVDTVRKQEHNRQQTTSMAVAMKTTYSNRAVIHNFKDETNDILLIESESMNDKEADNANKLDLHGDNTSAVEMAKPIDGATTDHTSKKEPNIHSVLTSAIVTLNVTDIVLSENHKQNSLTTDNSKVLEKGNLNVQHVKFPNDNLVDESIATLNICGNTECRHDSCKAILVCSGESVEGRQADVNELKNKLEMHAIEFDVNEVVQGILYSVEHTLEEIGNVNLLKKLQVESVSDVRNIVENVPAENTEVVETINENNNIIEHISKQEAGASTEEIKTVLKDEDAIKEMQLGTADINENEEVINNDANDVDKDTDKKDIDVHIADDLTSIESGNTEDLHYGTEIPSCKISPESHEVKSIIGKRRRKRTSGNKGSPKDVNLVGRKIELRQKISRSPLDNIALKHSIEENEYYKNEVLKANRREAKLKSKQAALLAKTADPVTNDSVTELDVPIPDHAKIGQKLEQIDNDPIPSESSAESEMSETASDTDSHMQKSLTTEDLLNCCKPCSVILVDFIRQLQINQQKLSETESESEEKLMKLDNEISTNTNTPNTVIENTISVEHDSVAKNILNKDANMVRRQRSKPSLDKKLLSQFGNLESESGEQTARKTVPPLKIKLKGGVRRKTYIVEPTVQPTIGPENKTIQLKTPSIVETTVQKEVKKIVKPENKTLKRKSTSSKSDSDSEKQKLHHKRRSKAQSLDPVPVEKVDIQTDSSPAKPSLHPPVVPNDAFEANFLQFIKEKESLGDRIPTIASATVDTKPLTRMADGKAYKVQANGSLTVSASGNGATSTCTSKSDMGLNEAAIAAQKKKAENAGQIMESYAKFREKIMNESMGKKTSTDNNEPLETDTETVEPDKNMIVATENTKYDSAIDIPVKQTEVNVELPAENVTHSEETDVCLSKRFVCSHCVFSSDTAVSMLEHTKTKHKNDIKYICPVCEKVYVEKELILHHCETVHSGQQVLYNCVPDFRDTKPEHDRQHDTETGSDSHGNIFDRINDLLESNAKDASKLQGDVDSLQDHYRKTSAEADSTTEVPPGVTTNDKVIVAESPLVESKQISASDDVEPVNDDASSELDLKIIDVVSLKPQTELPTTAAPVVAVAEPVVDAQAVVAQVNRTPQAELKIPSFTASGFPPQPQASGLNPVKSAPVVKDLVVPKRRGKLGHTFKCEKCNVHAPLLAAMVAHLRTVHKDIPRLFQCPYCRDLEAETEAKIHHHIESLHPTDNRNPPVALSEPAKSNLKTLTIPLPENRLSDTTLVEKDIYMCLKCKTHMPSLETIYDHLEAEHIEVFVSVCPFCKTFKSKDEDVVNNHIVTAHQRRFDELALSLAIDGNQFVRVPSLIKDKNKYSNKSIYQQQTMKANQPEPKKTVMSLTQKNLQRHQLMQQRQLQRQQAARMATNPGIARMMSHMNPQLMSAIDQSQLRHVVPPQKTAVPQTSPQTSVPSVTKRINKTVTSPPSSVPHHQPSQGSKKRKATLSDTIANLRMQKEAEQRALMNKSSSPSAAFSAATSAATASPLPTYQQAIELRNQSQQGSTSSQTLPPPLIRGPPPLIRFDQVMGPGEVTMNSNQSFSASSNQNVSQRLKTSGSPLSVSQQVSHVAKPIQSSLFDTSNTGSFGSAGRKPVLNIPVIPRSGNRPKQPGTPLDLSSKSTPSSSPALSLSHSPAPNVTNESNPEAFKIFNLKPNAPQPAQVTQLPVQQLVNQVRPNTSNTIAYRPTTPHIPNATQSPNVMSMPLNAAMLGGNVIVSIPNMQQNLQTVQQLQTLQQLVRLGTPVQPATALQNIHQLVRVGTPNQPTTNSIQPALQLAPRGMAIGQVNQQQTLLQTLPSPTPSPQQINVNLNLPMFKCPYCPKLTKLVPAEVQPHIETLHPGSSIVFKQCDT